MLVALRSSIRLPGIGRIAVVPVFAAVSVFALSAAGQSTPVQSNGASAAPASPAPASLAAQVPCPPKVDIDIPVSSTIHAKVKGLLDSGHVKVGQEIWVTVASPLVFPGCTLNPRSALYAHVMSALAQKNPNSSELSLAFDHADCEGQGKKAVPLRLIGLVSDEASAKMHDEVPIGLHGSGSRNADSAGRVTSGADSALNPGGLAHTVHPGIVVGMPKVKLEPEGGPGCSDRISSTNRSVELDPGAELILIMQAAP